MHPLDKAIGLALIASEYAQPGETIDIGRAYHSRPVGRGLFMFQPTAGARKPKIETEEEKIVNCP